MVQSEIEHKSCVRKTWLMLRQENRRTPSYDVEVEEDHVNLVGDTHVGCLAADLVEGGGGIRK